MDIKDKLKEIEEQVSVIKDPELKKVAFERLMDSLSTTKKTKTKSKKEPKGTKKRTVIKSSRPGPKKILTELLNSDFFNTPKKTLEIRSHLKLKTGHDYKSKHLSVSLLRMLREDQLTRDKNEKNQYEWKKA